MPYLWHFFLAMYENISLQNLNLSPTKYCGGILNEESTQTLISNFKLEGIKVFNKLNFDFALAFTHNNCLYLARDPFGNIPLFYYISKTNIYFSTQLKNLVESAEYKKKVNLNELKYYFNSSKAVYGYNNQTLWEEIYAVIPGQLLKINNKGEVIYENFFKVGVLEKNPLSDIFESFKEIFKKSILKNIEPSDILSSTLSGGIDSSSISCTLQSISNHKITTLELRTPFEIGKETKFAEDVVKKWQTNHFKLSKYPNFYEAERQNIIITGLPSFSLLTAARLNSLIDTAKKQYSNKIFIGEGGDQILGLQREYLDELINTSKFSELRKELINVLGYKGKTKEGLFQIPYGNSFIKGSLKKLIINRRVKDSIRFIFIFYNVSILFNQIKKMIFDRMVNSKENNENLINDILVAFEENKDEKTINHLIQIKIDNPRNINYLTNIFSRESIRLKEQYYLYGISQQIEFKYPFYDLEIMEYIASADKKVNFGNGIGRNIMRQSMKGILPDSIINRNSKTYFSPFLNQAFLDIYSDTKEIFHENHILWQYIDQKVFSIMVEIVKNTNYFDPNEFGTKNGYQVCALKVIYFGIWLDTYFN